MDRQTPLIIITGPTCSGKTDLAFALAQNHAMEIISADSMQVYRHMDIATAKPNEEERAFLPHHLIDIVNPDEQFQAGMFVQMARRKIQEVRLRKKLPVVVGGTGLYIKALIYGLAPAPGRSDAVRTALKKLIERKGIGYLETMLHKMDPMTSSRIRKNDALRIIRSLEILFLTGKRPSSIYRSHGFEKPVNAAHIACIMPDRQLLYRNIDNRVIRMVEKGLVEETVRLLSSGYGPELTSMQTLAYKHIIHHLDGVLSLKEAVSLVQRDTRHFAKRQITWMNNRPDHSFFPSTEKAFDTVASWLEKAAGAG